MTPQTESPSDRPSPRQHEAPWRAVVEGVAAQTGEHFFAALVRNLCDALGVAGCWVTEFLPETNRLRALAFWLNGASVAEYEYEIAGTPCEPVVRGEGLIHIPERVIDLFPNDPDLAPLNAVSYMGQRITDRDGTVLGHLAVLDTKPLPEEVQTQALFRVFAARAGAELLRLRAETEVHAREQQLRRLIDGAMDGIVEFDALGRVTMMNPSAAGFFGCKATDVLQEPLARFFVDASTRALSTLMARLRGTDGTGSSSWIPSGLVAKTCAGHEFPAEATLSRSDVKGQPYYTLILRNVDERQDAEMRIAALLTETSALREELRGSGNILGTSRVLRRVLTDLAQVAPTDATVLITGETGTGKELVAHAIHAGSPRSDGPFVPVNCAAIPAALIESELFGHEKGAFTGATGKRLGRFAMADGGTLFLDEIGELQPDLQVKLLRVLQEREFAPVGSSRSVKVDVRVVAATHRDLAREVDNGNFRQDLFYRLNVFPLEVPPLREREEDIVLLAESFTRQYARRVGRATAAPDRNQQARLLAYDWPGNVRELQNVIERAVITSTDGRLNLERALPEHRPRTPDVESTGTDTRSGDRVLTAAELSDLERANIERALAISHGKVSGKGGAAELLGMKSSTLSSRLKALKIVP
jgi:PAS domain S-box-containing protein